MDNVDKSAAVYNLCRQFVGGVTDYTSAAGGAFREDGLGDNFDGVAADFEALNRR